MSVHLPLQELTIPAKTMAAHALDPQLTFIASGTGAIRLIQGRAALVERLGRQWLAAYGGISGAA